MPANIPRRQPADVRRDQILDAAKAVMLERGVQRTTIAEIAESAGLGKGTVYLHFESKQEVLTGLVQRHIGRIEEEVRAAISRAVSAQDQIGAFVRAFAATSTHRPDLHHLFFKDALMNEAEAFAPLRALFAEIARAGAPKAAKLDELELAIEYAYGGLHAALVNIAHLPQRSRARAHAIDAVADLVTRSLS